MGTDLLGVGKENTASRLRAASNSQSRVSRGAVGGTAASAPAASPARSPLFWTGRTEVSLDPGRPGRALRDRSPQRLHAHFPDSRTPLFVPTEMQGPYFGIHALGSVAIDLAVQIGDRFLVPAYCIELTQLAVAVFGIVVGLGILGPAPSGIPTTGK